MDTSQNGYWPRPALYRDEPTLHPLDYEALAREALDGGFTQALDGFRPTRGYAVSTRKDAERIIARGLAPDHVANAIYGYVVDHGHDLRHGYLLGAWRDGDRVVIDLVQVFEDRDDAMRAARANGQDAVYDFAAGVEYRLPPLFEVVREGRFNSEADELTWLDAQADAELARYDDDPNPYNGTYSEE